jgi:hypothetical protein
MPSSLLAELTGLVPLLLFGGLLYLGIRKVPLSSGGGFGGLGDLAKVRALVIDAERPVTRFTDHPSATPLVDGRPVSLRLIPPASSLRSRPR